MTPPPGESNIKHDDDPLGGMDPMAWLESLARRQGANPDELTTAANLDIPTPPTDSKIDEPGYTPGYESARPEPAAVPLQPVAESPSDPLAGADPLAWLESLARRQGANPDELTTAANLDIPTPTGEVRIDEPGYTPGYESEARPKPVVEAPAPMPPAAPQPAMASAAPEDPFAGDPMAWLESLARRQGANVEELTTAANLDIPMPAADVKRDEPGYTPGYESAAQPKPSAPEPALAGAAADDPLGGMDPMAWLESLARRQGAKVEELTTAANLDIPMPAADVKRGEPGYVQYDPFSTGVSSAPQAAEPLPTPEPTAVGDDLLGGMDPLAWLESLAAQQSAPEEAPVTGGKAPTPSAQVEPAVAEGDFSTSMTPEEAEALLGLHTTSVETPAAAPEPAGEVDPMAWLAKLASIDSPDVLPIPGDMPVPAPPQPIDQFRIFGAPTESITPESALSWLEELAREQTVPPPPEPVQSAASIEMGGLSSDLNEIQAWLSEQARSLEETRHEFEEAQVSVDTPAEPGQLPDWLRESMPVAPEALTSSPPPLSDEIALPVTPSDLPSWLAEGAETPELDFSLGSLDLAPETPAVESRSPIANLSDTEVTELTGPASPEEIDSWAEALDEEYERRAAGDDTIPDWYIEALSRVERGEVPIPETTEARIEQTGPVQEFEEPEAIPAAELPDWLRGMSPDVPDVQAQPAEVAAAGEVPDWLQELAAETPEPVAGPAVVPPPVELPDWLRPGQTGPLSETRLPPEPVTPTPPPTPMPAVAEPIALTPPPAPPPQPARPAAVTPSTLVQAREHISAGQLALGLERYQALVDTAQSLEETRNDLRALAEQHPKEPKVLRLLGDTHMRLGDLQAALDTYLSALNEL